MWQPSFAVITAPTSARPILKIGNDYGNSVEVVSGLQPTDAVVVNPSDSLTDGTQVRVSNNSAGGSAK
jgi:hypothetical protein